MKTQFLLSITLLLSISACAQEIERVLYLDIGLGANNFNDEAVSPLNYSGSPFFFSLGYVKNRSGQSVSRFDFGGNAGSVAAQLDSDIQNPTGQTYRLVINYEYLRFINSYREERLQFFVGGGLYFQSDLRLHYQLDNSLVTYQVMTSLAPNVGIIRPFETGNRKLEFTGKVAVPLVSHVMRPDRLNRIDFLDLDYGLLRDNFERGGFYTVNKAFRLISSLEINYLLSNGNKLRLGYRWDFTHLAFEPGLTSASHDFYFGFLFNL